MCIEILKTCVYFTGYKKRIIFIFGKCLLPENEEVTELCCQCLCFLINDNRNMCTENSEHSDCISHSITHTHTIYIYIYIYIVLKELLEFLRNFPSPLCEVAVSKFPVSRCCLITKSHSVLFQTAVMNLHIIIT